MAGKKQRRVPCPWCAGSGTIVTRTRVKQRDGIIRIKITGRKCSACKGKGKLKVGDD